MALFTGVQAVFLTWLGRGSGIEEGLEEGIEEGIE